jgi:outer membrane protein assembly factor BamB
MTLSSVAGTSLTGCSSRPIDELPIEPSKRDHWKTYRHDWARTGYNPAAAGPTDKPNERWRYQPKNYISTPPAVVAGTVYAGDVDGIVYAVDAESGTHRWKFDLPIEEVTAAPAVTSERVYVGGSSLFAVDTSTGSKQWQFDAIEGLARAPAVTSNVVCIPDTSTGLFGVTPSTGEILWHFSPEQVASGARNAPAVSSETVYYATTTHVFAIDLSNGRERWRTEVGSVFPVSAGPILGENTVYVCTGDYLRALDIRDGSEQWQTTFDSLLKAPPAVAQGTVYVGTFYGRLHAINTSNGNKQWTVHTGEDIWSSPTVAANTVYVSDRTGEAIHAVDVDGGRELLSLRIGAKRWRRPLSVAPLTPPVVVGETVYVGGSQLVALR